MAKTNKKTAKKNAESRGGVDPAISNGAIKESNEALANRLIKAARQVSQREFHITIEGVSPLIVHRFGSKAATIMLDKQLGGPRASKKDPKVPVAQAFDGIHFFSEEQPIIPSRLQELTAEEALERVPLEFLNGVRVGFPASGFKESMVRAGKAHSLAMTDSRSAIFVQTGPIDEDRRHADLVEIIPLETPIMRCDHVTIAKGTNDLRFRTEYPTWTATLEILYDDKLRSPDNVIAMLTDAGQTVGVGEWRPERRGPFGKFRITDISVLR